MPTPDSRAQQLETAPALTPYRRLELGTASALTPHRRFDPLRRDWVLVSPQRTARPWQGQIEQAPEAHVPEYDPSCYLCPRNPRAGGAVNPDYKTTFVFDNDYPALTIQDAGAVFRRETAADLETRPGADSLLVAQTETGVCRVLCFSPRHDLTVSRMDRPAIRGVVDAWIDESLRLGARDDIAYVQIFENRGAAMGASNPHPHCQLWATASVPNEPAREQESLDAHRKAHGSCLLCDYLAIELERRERLVCDNDAFVALVPFWAVWPFETLVVPRRHVRALDDLHMDERDGLADILKRLTSRYDNLFATAFPYSMGFHVRPSDGAPHDEWHMHAHFYPPLLRSATVRKFMVGFEMLGTPQRDLTAEDAAARLRAMKEER